MPRDVVLTIANAIGIAIYLALASRGWRIPQEHGLIPVTGEPFVWVLALPLLGVFLLTNTVWAVMLIRRKEREGMQWWLAAAAVWVLAIGIDFSRH
jgi:hypothetical protein